MNTRYLALLVTLALLGFSVPAAAHPCDRDPVDDHKHCIAETPQTTFDVEMVLQRGNFESEGDGPETCTGTATGNNLGPSFDFNLCGITLTNGGGFFGLGSTVDVCLLGASVRISKKRTRVMIFMYSPCDAGGNVFRTLELPATVNDTGAGSFEVILDSAGPYVLTKNHQPDKERPLEEGIFLVGKIIVYEEQPVAL